MGLRQIGFLIRGSSGFPDDTLQAETYLTYPPAPRRSDIYVGRWEQHAMLTREETTLTL